MTNKDMFNDYVNQFKDWLRTSKKYKKNTVSTRISNIKVVGKYYDILKEFAIDECQGILDDLQYSKNDNKPKTSIAIAGNYYNGLSTYRQTLKLFIDFLKDIHYIPPVLTKPTSAKFIGNFDKSYNVARAKGVSLTTEVEFVCRILENEYASIIKFAEDLLVQGNFDSIPIIVSDEIPPKQESPFGEEKVLGKFFESAKPYIEIYYRNFDANDAASIRNCLAHEYLHYLHYVFAEEEFDDSKTEKGLKEGLADFFGFLYSIHRHGKDDLNVAKKRYDSWEKYFLTFWPYANALYFMRINGKEIKYSENYNNYIKKNCVGKFVQVFFSTQHPDNAHKLMLY